MNVSDSMDELRDFISTDAERARQAQRREDFERDTPWKIGDIEIDSEAKMIAALMTQSAKDLAWTHDCIEDGLRQDAKTLAAWRTEVLEIIEPMIFGEHAPNPLRIWHILTADNLDLLCERYTEG
jgi:hypothetical protein